MSKSEIAIDYNFEIGSYTKFYKLRSNKQLSVDEQKFFDWMDLVEEKVAKQTQLDLLELPDENYRVNFENGMTPNEMSQIVIDNFLAMKKAFFLV